MVRTRANSTDDGSPILPSIPEEVAEGHILETPTSGNEEQLSMKSMLTAIRNELRNLRAEVGENRIEMSRLKQQLGTQPHNMESNVHLQSGSQQSIANQVRNLTIPSTSQSLFANPTTSVPLNTATSSSNEINRQHLSFLAPVPGGSSQVHFPFPSSSYESSIAYLNQFQPVGGIRQSLDEGVQSNQLGQSVSNMTVGGTRKKLQALPEFSGSAKEWPIFEASFHESNIAYRYTDLENNFRLIQALKGHAKDSVEGLLLFPRNVNEVMRKLKFEFGRPELIVKSQLEEIRKISPIEEHNLEQSILKFSNKVGNMVTFIESCGSHHHLSNPMLLEELIFKLPHSKRYEWIQFASTLEQTASVKDFSRWLTRVAELIAMLPTDPKRVVKAKVMTTLDNSSDDVCDYSSKPPLVASITNQTSNLDPKPPRKCLLCSQGHFLKDCESFLKLSISERWDLVKKLRTCFCCLFKGHGIFNCRKKKRCEIDNCPKFHNKLLHNHTVEEGVSEENSNDVARDTSSKDTSNKSVLQCNLITCNTKIFVKVVPIFIYGPKGKMQIYAFIDEGSQISMLNKHIAKQLGLEGEPINLNLKWLNNQTIQEESYVCNLEASGLTTTSDRLKINNIKVVENMQLSVQCLDYDDLCTKYKYLKGLPVVNQNNVIPDLLIGLDNLDAFHPQKLVFGKKDEPSAVKTPLGWIVFGPARYNINEPDSYSVFKTEIYRLDDVHNMISDYFSNDSLGIEPRPSILESEEDIKAKQILNRTSKKSGNHFETGLLWKDENICLPDSFPMAKSRLMMIEKKMSSDVHFAEGYIKAVQAFIDKGYARKLSNIEAKVSSKRTWYLPHFGVVNVNKPGKVRVVFDAAARVKGISLNDALLKGPDQYQPLLCILFRFREGKVGVCADIQEMFPQVLICQQDRDSQRFLWRNGNSTKSIDVYEMVAMTFGSKCSPCSAQFIKNLNAMDYLANYPKAVKEIVESHYVDDYVTSFDSEEEALEISHQVKEIHSKAGFNLRGFVSNSITLCESLNGNLDTTLNMNVGDDEKTEKILGMYWETSLDNFTFKFKYNKIKEDVLSGRRFPTKRELLALVMSVFDPFGLVANFLIRAKLLLQEVWKQDLKWDDSVCESIAVRWYSIQCLLKEMETLKVPRCHFTKNDKVQDVELHCFVDASESAMAAVCYFKAHYLNGEKSLSFVCGKTKCCPMKYMSVPRCELQAAVMGSRLKKSIIEFYRIPISSTFFWSDSQTVLYWIKSEHKRYHQFVDNRISEILDHSDKNQWMWVPTKLNPADEGTRSKSPNLEFSRWIEGPHWLLQKTEWPEQPSIYETETTAQELRRNKSEHVLLVNLNSHQIIDFNRFSSYIRLLRTTAWVLRYIENLKASTKLENKSKGPLSSIEISKAESTLCLQAQKEGFGNDYHFVQSKKSLPRRSNLRRHLPYLDESYVLRARGRIDNSALSVCTKRPILLPKQHMLSLLIIKYYHEKYFHQNEDVIICEIRRKFWIDGLRMLVRRFGKKCVKCCIDKARTYQPEMGQLPKDRLTPFIRPFSYTGLDFFGPVTVAIGRRVEKRWIALFTCLTVRAIHIEISPDLTSDSCIMCIRNFINFRGKPVRIRTDNGTNFIGARNELIRSKNFYGNIAIKDKMASEGIEWMCNTPLNPAEGGCWERMIRTVKRVLKATLKERHPKEDTLRSFLYEAMNIVNSRPLTHVPVESIDSDPLTPNDLLIGTPNSVQTFLPEGYQVNLRKQWRVVQQMTTTFWKRWVSESLPLLTRRVKWFGDELVSPIKENDLVIICDQKTERNTWNKGIVVSLLTDKNGVARKARVKTNSNVFERPVSKLAVIDISGSNL